MRVFEPNISLMPALTLLLQLIVILGTARICGWLLRFVGQPSVVGEMAAGMVLGPVVMGALFPDLHEQIFAKSSLAGLSALSTIGLVLFMFIVGLEMRGTRGVGGEPRSPISAPSLHFDAKPAPVRIFVVE